MMKKLMLATIASLVLVGGPVSAARDLETFEVKIDGDIFYEDLESELVNVGRGNPQKTIIFRRQGDEEQPVLRDFWRYTDGPPPEPKSYANGTTGVQCFTDPVTLLGIHIQETKSGAGQAVFWFTSPFQYAPGEYADKIPRYKLTIIQPTGWVDVANNPVTFPPTDETIFLDADGWLMETEGKGQYRTTSCKGMGTDAAVTFELTRNPK